MKNGLTKYVLRGSEYVRDTGELRKRFPMNGKFLYDEIPEELRATEERVRGSVGAGRDGQSRWAERHLTWWGCPVAVSMYESWIRCSNKPRENGYCGMHQRRVPA